MALTEKLAAIGNAIRAKTGRTEKLTLDQMPNEIASITTGGGPIVLTGNCNYVFHGSFWNNYINSETTTRNITSGKGMFYESDVENIPFDINLTNDESLRVDCSEMFSGNTNIKIAPKIIGSIGKCQNIFRNCYRLREIPDGEFINNMANSEDNIYMNEMFRSCYSLRELPMSYLEKFYLNYYASTSIYTNAFQDCNTLNKIENLPVYTEVEWTNNAFSGTFLFCNRLNKVTFKQQSGTPYVAKWSEQTIDLTQGVGYVSHNNSYILNYNSGITADKEVTTYNQYKTLKNDPDWFTQDMDYCRYNRTSAVETINSLPDTSAYLATAGGTNTIKFKGASGSATDGGAINTMTEEQIAVATAKGWTVSYV